MAGSERRSARHWLSIGFTDLAARIAAKVSDDCDFDVLVIGSGYGGIVAAHHLAGVERDGKPLSIGILERGNEYVAGEFPAEPGDLPIHTRLTKPNATAAAGERDGLFDVRVGSDVASLVANGLGGGSLINAGVMMRPLPSVFEHGWPKHIAPESLDAAFDECESLLGAMPLPSRPRKFEALDKLHAGQATPVPITIASDADRHVSTCNYCGNCATGCNFGAKRSLDVQLLAAAREKNDRLECFTGATVERIDPGVEPGNDCRWIVRVSHTAQAMREKFPGTTAVRARWVIVCAGTYGSTELLMKSRSEDLPLSNRLGERFSTNGDMLAVGWDQDTSVHALATGAGPRSPDTGPGPTITGALDFRESDGILIEEVSVPWPLRPFFEEIFATANTLDEIGRVDWSTHRAGQVGRDPCLIDEATLERTSIWALMGDDGAGGRLVLPDPEPDSDGTLAVSWPSLPRHELFRRQISLLDRLRDRSSIGGRNLPSPLWRPLPASMSYLSGAQTGPIFTVHPLGGCAMADSGESGVVDDCGRVFAGDTDQVHDGLVVLDGSIIPTALGANPALTISAIALRAIQSLAIIWGFRQADAPARGAELPPRPRYREIDDVARQPTEIDINERLVGPVELDNVGECIVELTLVTAPVAARDLVRGTCGALDILSESRLRIFEREKWQALIDSDPVESLEDALDDIALVIANLDGTLGLFRRQSTTALSRIVRSAGAWLLNRGMRDIWQLYIERRELHDEQEYATSNRFLHALALASRAGERRTLEYDLRVMDVARAGPLHLDHGQRVCGIKVLTYGSAANPLRQLTELKLTAFPGLRDNRPVLSLDSGYLARIGVPLVRVVRQSDAPTALRDIAGLGGYVLRLLLGIHGWSFRLPDRPSIAPLCRLPGHLPNVPVFEQFAMTYPERDLPGPAVLTRYRNSGGRPLLFIHGYSASGTTFAHESLSPSAAEFFWRAGRDVWVLDLRTSAGLATAAQPWTFEEVASTDIPVAVGTIWAQTNQRIDVVAHCMGAAMFSMGVLAPDSARHLLHERVRKVVLSQVGPGVVFTPGNIFRAYAMMFGKHYLELTRFDLRVDPATRRLVDQLLDRLLNVLPYPKDEYRIENPLLPWKRTGFVSTRHRMDLLYGRDFSLENVSPAFLENIDAFFGPLNLDTVSQAIAFARWKNITDKSGRNRYVLRRRIREHWKFDTMSLHGRENAVASVQTVARNRVLLGDAGVDYRAHVLDGFGHQDVWVSQRSEKEVFERVHEFLEDPESAPGSNVPGLLPLVARPPHLGPVLASMPDERGAIRVRLGTSPNLDEPAAIALVNVNVKGEPASPLSANLEIIEDFERDAGGMVRLEVAGSGPRLILVLYDEHPALLDVAFGDTPIETLAASDRYEPGDRSRIEDAVRRAFTLPRRVLDAGVVVPSRRSEANIVIAFASCWFPAGPFDRVPAYAAWERLHSKIESGESPGLLLLLGDQVYVDPTGGLFDPERAGDRYRIPYEQWLSADTVQRVLGRVPTFMMLDDHELHDNWEPLASGNHLPSMTAGEAAFRRYQFDSGSRRNADKFWGPLDDTPLPVFMLNSRTDRKVRGLTRSEQGEMFSSEQLAALKSWLVQVPVDVPKIVTSASLPLPRHLPHQGGRTSMLSLDGWDGYPASLFEMLEFIARERVRRVVFLSGDEHLPLIASADIMDNDERVARLYSIHTAALYAPIPFANAVPEHFVLDDVFAIAPGLECRVSTETFDPAFGFTWLGFEQSDRDWMLKVVFDGSGVERRLLLD